MARGIGDGGRYRDRLFLPPCPGLPHRRWGCPWGLWVVAARLLDTHGEADLKRFLDMKSGKSFGLLFLASSDRLKHGFVFVVGGL